MCVASSNRQCCRVGGMRAAACEGRWCGRQGVVALRRHLQQQPRGVRGVVVRGGGPRAGTS